MENYNKKQKKSLIFSSALVATGCLIAGLYVNQNGMSMEDYEVDLSSLDTKQEESTQLAQGTLEDPSLSSGAALAKVSGSSVVDGAAEKSKQNTENEVGSSKESTKAKEKSAGENTSIKESLKSEAKANTKEKTEAKSIKEKQNSEIETESMEELEMAPKTKESSEKTTETMATESLTFLEADGMTWPVLGNVILGYSMEQPVYFQTLMQYQYNPAILIGASEGDNVSAAAKGVVKEIGNDEKLGNYLKMELGSGYEVTYGQLDQIGVKEGDLVSRGQVIAQIGQASRYFEMEGSHLYLKIEKDGKSIDPLTLLQ